MQRVWLIAFTLAAWVVLLTPTILDHWIHNH